jgi:GWxTD domain-containing protein
MLPAEVREFERLRSDAEVSLFAEEFWRRRDPEPEVEGNPARDRFRERVTAADRLYAEGSVRGSLTDRGRALVLLGPPSLLRAGRRTSPAWRPADARRESMPVRRIPVETWEYGVGDLPPHLAARLDGARAVSLTFEVGDRTRLVEGGDYLQLAAEAMVRLP